MVNFPPLIYTTQSSVHRSLPPSRVPAALFWPDCGGEKCGQTMQVFFFSLSLKDLRVVLLVPLYRFVQIRSSYGPSMSSLTCVCSICSQILVSFELSQLLTSSTHSRRVGWTGRHFCTILFLWRSLHVYCSRYYLV